MSEIFAGRNFRCSRTPRKIWELIFEVDRNECILRELIFADLKKLSLFQFNLE